MVPVASSTTEKRASVKADGLKMCTRLPSRFQRTNALPANPTGNQEELPVEDVVLEPEEQVGAEDDRKGPPAELIVLAARPGQQDVEGIGKQQLAGKQREKVVDRRPVIAPVGIDAAMAEGLDVVLGPGRDHDDPRPARLSRRTEPQPCRPENEGRGGAPERPGQDRRGLKPRQRRQGQQSRGKGEGNGKRRDHRLTI